MEAMRHQLLEKRRNLDGSTGGGAAEEAGGGEEPRAKRSRWGGEEESRGAGAGGGAGGEEDGQQDACRVFWSLQGKKRGKWLNQGEEIDIESLRRPKPIG